VKQGHIQSRAFNALAIVFCIGLAILGNGTAVAQDDPWTFDPQARIDIGAISAETVTRDEDVIIDGDGFTFRGQISAELADKDTRFRLEADRIEVVRLDDDRRDYNRDRLTASVEQDFGPEFEVQLRARYTDDIALVESADTDEYHYNYITFDLRAESIQSDDERRGFNRQSVKASYTHPVTPDLRIRPALQVIRTEFDGRLTDTGARRQDTLIAPEVKAMYWPGNWRIEAQAKYIFSDSNLASRDREGYRLTLAVGHVF